MWCRTDTDYDDALIAKLYVFMFVNSYAALFFVAFIKVGRYTACVHCIITWWTLQLLLPHLHSIFGVLEWRCSILFCKWSYFYLLYLMSLDFRHNVPIFR